METDSWKLHVFILRIADTSLTVSEASQKKDSEHCLFIVYRTRAIITRGLYIFYPIFQCGL